MKFTLKHTDGLARSGQLETAHGVIDTPTFMPVGTAGTVKAMTADAVRSTGAQVVLVACTALWIGTAPSSRIPAVFR
jgi:queuine tRNA-ribosyltransferase